MIDRKRLRAIGVPEDMSADDVKALFSLPDDDDRMHQQGRRISARRHQVDDGDCVYCDREKAAANTFHPPHDASENCQSGKRPHCSCDTCF
jgi:hypothetical protein